VVTVEPTQPKRIVPSNAGVLSCLAVNSSIQGQGARYVADPDRRNIGNWGRLDTTVSWSIVPATAGVYEVIVVQALGDGLSGSRYAVEAHGATLEGEVRGTGSWTDYVEVSLGRLTLAAGPQTLTVRGLSLAGGRCVMNLREVRLVPQEQGSATPR
jgi:hypothetical protein